MLVVVPHIAPVCFDKIAVPLILVFYPCLVKQRHSNPSSLEFIRPQHLQKCFQFLCMLQFMQTGLQRRCDPLNLMAEQVQQDEALHLKSNVRIQCNRQAVKDTCARRFKVLVPHGKSVLDDFRRNSAPHIHKFGGSHRLDRPLSDKFMSR